MGVFDAGITEDGYSYIAREYIEGETLETILKRAGGPLDVVFAARIAIAVAKGLRSYRVIPPTCCDAKRFLTFIVHCTISTASGTAFRADAARWSLHRAGTLRG